MASDLDRPVASFEDLDAIIEGQRRIIAKLEGERDALKVDLYQLRVDKVAWEQAWAPQADELEALKAEYAQFAKDQETVNLASDERETKLEAERDALNVERNRLEAVVVRVTDERDALRALIDSWAK